MHLTARNYASIMRLLMEDEWSKTRLKERTGLHHVTIAHYIAALHEEKIIRISSWRMPRPGPSVPYYSLNVDGEKDEPKPRKKTPAERARDEKKRKAAIRMNHRLAGRIE
jgi:transcription initiation factor IIE alpha subunit